MLYTISKLRKSTIQWFKRCAIRSWNEEVAVFASQSLQVEGSIFQSVAKSPFCCEVIPQPFCIVGCISSWRCPTYTARGNLGTLRWKPTSQPCEDSMLLRNISQPLLSACEISQTPFSLAKWFLKHPDICYRHLEIFSIRFLLSKSQNTPCKPPITWFLSF